VGGRCRWEAMTTNSTPLDRSTTRRRGASQTASPLFKRLMGCGGSRWWHRNASSSVACHMARPLAASYSSPAVNSSRHSSDTVAGPCLAVARERERGGELGRTGERRGGVTAVL
jgi:hypothetical protein